MIKEVIGTGATEQEALENAKKELGISDDTVDFEIEVVQRAEKKKFGLFGGAPAKVKVSINIPDEVVMVDEPEEVEAESYENINSAAFVVASNDGNNTSFSAVEEIVQNDISESVSFADGENPADVAEKYLRDILNAMNLSSINIERQDSENAVKFDLSGDEVGFVIGRRGDTLDSLQYLTSLVANHKDNSYFKVTIDTGNYREKREKTLEILGRKLAFKAVKTGRRTSLEPMNPYERRIIHTAVQKINGAVSWSEGENANRHVVIGPDPKSRRRPNYNKGRGGRRPYNSNRFERTAPTVNPDRKPLNEGGTTGLYGRIDK